MAGDVLHGISLMFPRYRSIETQPTIMGCHLQFFRRDRGQDLNGIKRRGRQLFIAEACFCRFRDIIHIIGPFMFGSKLWSEMCCPDIPFAFLPDPLGWSYGLAPYTDLGIALDKIW